MKDRSAMRLARLQQALAGGGTIHLREAARLCGVSEMTIRRDLAASDGAMTLLGGRLVMANHPHYAPVYDVDVQKDSHALAKRRLCERAAGFIADGDTLFIDCGTTLLPLVSQLATRERLTVVTYALNVANAVSLMSEVRLVLLGGLYHASSQSFGSDDMSAAIKRLGINRAFISAAGVHAERGVSCFHFHEVAPKQAAIACAEQRLLVVDESKIGQVRPAYFARLDDFDVVITDGDMALPQTNGGPRIVAA
ncbi:DeoR/GlpR transcriptional regulator [Billgrantia tianxiuensis]|jgi:DeoR family deoxyribose operon repressor|uniref:DeoR/GlpR transcriptional regulator n=1 Tax=Billgrantia tianxiuensis TaxID=2497861 RepID=A0A6I6SIH1_9GAMM|nr:MULTISPECIES: DeoR/GlpR family DNA-binding transcription regulator [Halomonas]MCE8035053.1 DeoR/GlpR transcriptional regulator [Halomonas sp. MCCC 1A11057]QHC48446.1 DeoR/GlpR transcriptional regulator [Halomonas tianxiuensis]